MPALGAQAIAETFSLTGWLRRSMLSRCVDPSDVLPFLPRIVADHGVARECAQRYASFRALPKSVGLTSFHAEHDDRVTREEALSWTEIGAEPGQVRYRFLPGQDHFFCDSETGRELAFEEIRSVLGDTAASGHTLVLFPGQGIQQHAGLVDGLEAAPEWKLAEDVLGYDLLSVCQETPARLRGTRIGQAGIYVMSYLRWKRWAKLEPARAEKAKFAGFSLGEITALVAAGVFTFEQGLELIRVRGETMESACRSAPSTMITLIGLQLDAVSILIDDLNRSRGKEVSWLCNELWDEGFVVGVIQEEADALREQARAAGARQAIQLEVEGAFHTPLMQEAQGAFADALARLQSSSEPTLRTTVYSNVTGAPYQSVGEVMELLPQQICSPVRWIQVLTHVSGLPERITSVIVPAPGEQIAGMLKNQSRALYHRRNLV
jgi:[acyl-carrier-protein] S-malonyltransferase